MNSTKKFNFVLGLTISCALAACETPMPRNDVPTVDAVDSGVTMDMPTVDMPTVDMPTVDMPTIGQETGPGDVVDVPVVADVPSDVPSAPVCMPGATEFQPRSMMARPAKSSRDRGTAHDARFWLGLRQ